MCLQARVTETGGDEMGETDFPLTESIRKCTQGLGLDWAERRSPQILPGSHMDDRVQTLGPLHFATQAQPPGK